MEEILETAEEIGPDIAELLEEAVGAGADASMSDDSFDSHGQRQSNEDDSEEAMESDPIDTDDEDDEDIVDEDGYNSAGEEVSVCVGRSGEEWVMRLLFFRLKTNLMRAVKTGC